MTGGHCRFALLIIWRGQTLNTVETSENGGGRAGCPLQRSLRHMWKPTLTESCWGLGLRPNLQVDVRSPH